MAEIRHPDDQMHLPAVQPCLQDVDQVVIITPVSAEHDLITEALKDYAPDKDGIIRITSPQAKTPDSEAEEKQITEAPLPDWAYQPAPTEQPLSKPLSPSKQEEDEELWAAIKADERDERIVKESIQCAAMVFRYLETGDRYRGNLYKP